MAVTDLPTKFIDFDASYIASLAAEHGYTYTELSSNALDESSIYSNPLTKTRELHKLQMVIDGFECEYYTAEYVPLIMAQNPLFQRMLQDAEAEAKAETGAKTQNNAAYQVQIFSVTLPYVIEDVYVESRTNITLNNILGLSSVVFRDSEKARLEGDFNAFFRVYVPKGEQLHAFTILAPNIMVRMLESGSNFDFEFSQNKVYFYQVPAYFTGGKITLKKQAYSDLLAFGIESAKSMARAARPTRLRDGTQSTPMWKLYGTNSTKQVVSIGLIFASFIFLFICIILPPLWPVLGLAGLVFYIKYVLLKMRRKRLIRAWHKS